MERYVCAQPLISSSARNLPSSHTFSRENFPIFPKINTMEKPNLAATTFHATPTGGAALSFDFPEDVLLCILSFLTPSEIGSFCCTSKRFVSIGRSDSRIWYALCDRRWGGRTQIKKWGNGKVAYKLLYRTLTEWEDLIGFWRRSGQGTAVSSPSLVYFEWGPSFITGSRVSSSQNGTYEVVKAPFLWMSLSQEGQIVNFIDPQGKSGVLGGGVESVEDLGFMENDLVPVHVSFIGRTHLVVEENMGFSYNYAENAIGESSSSSSVCVGDDHGMVEDLIGTESSPPGTIRERFMSDIYQYFANRTSPGADRRRQRRREKERQGRRKREPEHFVKIVNCSPTASRPLQGLWKGISDDTSMDFYLVVYDETGGISCRKVGDTSERAGEQRFSAYAPVFWTSNSEFIEYPLSSEEENIYETRIHHNVMENEAVTHLLFINSSYDLVIPGTTPNPRQAEGRIWQYRNGTFGFGFLRDNFIIDLKHITKNGCLLDTYNVELS